MLAVRAAHRRRNSGQFIWIILGAVIALMLIVHTAREIAPTLIKLQPTSNHKRNSRTDNSRTDNKPTPNAPRSDRPYLKHMEIPVSEITKHDTAVHLHAGERVQFLKFSTGYHSFDISGVDLTRELPGRDRCNITIAQVKTHLVFEVPYLAPTYIRTVITEWLFISTIDLQFRSAFVRDDTSLYFIYNAPLGFITVVGLNVTMRSDGSKESK